MVPTTYQLEQTGNLVLASLHVPMLDAGQIQELVEEMTQKMRNDNAVYFLLDMKQVEFISSACLGLLVMFMQDLEHMRGRLGLVHCRPNVAFVFKVTRLDSVFPLYDDLEQAGAEILGR